MRREPHVRFREGGGVKFPSATRPEKNWRRLDGHNQLPKIILGVRFTDGIEVVKLNSTFIEKMNG